MQIFVVHKPDKGRGDGAKVWVFTEHEDALRCRRENKLNHFHLWGCVIDCYEFRQKEPDVS